MRQADVIKRHNARWPVFYTPPSTAATPSHISFFSRACEVLGVDQETMLSRCRHRDIARKRHAIFHVMHGTKGMGYSQIGRAMRCDHSSVIYGVKNSQHLVQRDEAHKAIVDALEMVA